MHRHLHRHLHRNIRHAVFAFFAFAVLAAPAARASVPKDSRAAISSPPASSTPAPVNQAVVKTVADYLNALTTLKARFVQTAQDGARRSGTFYLKRPGKMRIVYDPPDKDFIVADGLFIHYYDSSTERTSSTLISHSIADFFLRRRLELSGNVTVSAAAQKGSELTMTVEQTKNPLAGSLTLILDKDPLTLKSWRVVDAEGLVTTVDLSAVKTGISLDGTLFQYYDPARAKHLYNKN